MKIQKRREKPGNGVIEVTALGKRAKNSHHQNNPPGHQIKYGLRGHLICKSVTDLKLRCAGRLSYVAASQEGQPKPHHSAGGPGCTSYPHVKTFRRLQAPPHQEAALVSPPCSWNFQQLLACCWTWGARSDENHACFSSLVHVLGPHRNLGAQVACRCHVLPSCPGVRGASVGV